MSQLSNSIKALPLLGTGLCLCAEGREADLIEQATPLLRTPKMRKYMGRQDLLAVVAAHQAAQEARLSPDSLKACGLYLAAGFIPFETNDLNALIQYSDVAGEFDIRKFADVAIKEVNPLLTFRCLPNMPAFHISYNLGMHGSYFVTHPGPSQFYQALNAAVTDLRSGRIGHALVGGVVDLNNALAHFRIQRQLQGDGKPGEDVAAFICLSQAGDQLSDAQAWLDDMAIRYSPHDPLNGAPSGNEIWETSQQTLNTDSHDHPCDLPVHVHHWLRTTQSAASHHLTSRDGFTCHSHWRRT